MASHPLAVVAALITLPPAHVAGQEQVVRLTHSGARNGQAFFSPDGARISFVSNRGGSWQAWLMAAEGGPARQLTRSSQAVGWPSWSGGDAILYYAGSEGGHRLHRLDLRTGASEPLRDDGLEDFRPSLSPDGRTLLFDRYGASVPPNHDIFARDVASGRLRRLTLDPGYDSDARWSPDGQSIVFHSDRDGPERYATQVYVMNADGSDVRRLTEGPAVNAYPAWSLDGRFIAYTSEIEGNRDIWVMHRDGSSARPVTRHPGFDGDPVWAPGGGHILFATDRFGGHELALVSVATTPRSGAAR